MFARLVFPILLTFVLVRPAVADITTGLIARYTFDGNANDVSGNNNHGSLVGPVALTTDRFGIANRAYAFNGINTYVLVPASPSLNSPTTECTQAGWVYIAGTSLVGAPFNPLLMKSTEAANAFMYRMITNTEYVGAAFNNWDTARSAGHNTAPDTWHHFATVFNGTNIRYYRDGVHIGTQALALTIATDNRPLTIGADTPGYLEVFNGRIDDVTIFNRALSDADIVELCEQATPTAVAGSTPPFTLGMSVPNPMGAESKVEFTLASEQTVEVDIFDVAGRRVRTIETGRRVTGRHVAVWDGRSDDGRETPSGLYFLRLKAGQHMQTTRIVRVR
jgi:hypothetical protein